MKHITSIPEHYRQLGPDEIIQKGDLWSTGILMGYATSTIGSRVSGVNSFYTYWRRRHITVNHEKKMKVVLDGVSKHPAKQIADHIVPSVKKQHPVEKNPLVSFYYPKSGGSSWNKTYRLVRLIAADAKYYIGLEVNDKNRFKKFLRSKVSQFTFVEFNPSAI
jgi:hypothetical protein